MKIAIPLMIATLTLAALSPAFAQSRGVTDASWRCLIWHGTTSFCVAR
jgi:hypothetical protein